MQSDITQVCLEQLIDTTINMDYREFSTGNYGSDVVFGDSMSH